jgi:hypothetical protein
VLGCYGGCSPGHHRGDRLAGWCSEGGSASCSLRAQSGGQRYALKLWDSAGTLTVTSPGITFPPLTGDERQPD